MFEAAHQPGEMGESADYLKKRQALTQTQLMRTFRSHPVFGHIYRSLSVVMTDIEGGRRSPTARNILATSHDTNYRHQEAIAPVSGLGHSHLAGFHPLAGPSKHTTLGSGVAVGGAPRARVERPAPSPFPSSRRRP